MSCRHLDGMKCTNASCPFAGRAVNAPVCARCDHYDGPPRGAGDRVEAVTRATGLKRLWERLQRFWKPATATARTSCGGCAARRRALNERFPANR